jgi:hypothetical protein
MENTERFRVECKIDGKWFKNDAVFPTAKSAEDSGRGMVECGAAADYRMFVTGAPVNLPEEDDGESEGESSDEDDPSSYGSCAYAVWDEFLSMLALLPFSWDEPDDMTDPGLAPIYEAYEDAVAVGGWDAR